MTVVQDSIERSITINAPLDRVWELVTDPGWWVPDESGTVGDRTPGAVTVRESPKWGRYPVRVVEFRPKTYAAFQWACAFTGEEPTDINSTLIEFTLAESPDGVMVTVLESGFAALPLTEEARHKNRDANSSGWEEELAGLRDRALAA